MAYFKALVLCEYPTKNGGKNGISSPGKSLLRQERINKFGHSGGGGGGGIGYYYYYY